VGSVGSKEGYSTVIVRSAVGEELVQRLDAEKGAADKSEVARLAKFKRERAKKKLQRSQSNSIKTLSLLAVYELQTIEPSSTYAKDFLTQTPHPLSLR